MKDNKKIFRYNLLTKKLLLGKASREEMKELSDWKIISSKMTNQLKEIETDTPDEEVGQRMWININKQCYKPNRRIDYKRYWQMTAAACIAALVTVGAFWLTDKNSVSITEYVAVSAQNSLLYTLPDSSKVWMQAGSTIRYAKAFDTERNVWLTGESTFEVKKKNGLPFKVNINQAYVEVKGTVFRVLNQVEGESAVTLFSGKVNFNTNSGKTIEMSPRQRVLYNSAKDDITVQTIGNITWEDGVYKFTDMQLDALIQAIEDIYHISISVSPKINQKHLFTGTIEFNAPITTIMERICFNMNCTYKQDNKAIAIY